MAVRVILTLMDKLICVGKNYDDHAAEMAAMTGEVKTDKPVLFLKPSACLDPHPIPTNDEVHPELEIVYQVQKAPAGQFQLSAVTLGLDFTRRGLQSALKKLGQPWERSKCFPGSAWVAPWIPVAAFADHLQVPFQLWVNGQLRQQGLGSKMRLSPDSCLEEALQAFPVRHGDCLFTGTPAGVAAVLPGDSLRLVWGNHLDTTLTIR